MRGEIFPPHWVMCSIVQPTQNKLHELNIGQRYMIDYTKSKNFKTDINSISSNPHLKDSWQTTKRDLSGEVLAGSGKYKDLSFVKKYGRIEFKGSIHKYFNGGLHNYNDFNVVDISSVVSEIEEKFEADIYDTELCNLEFGVNVVFPFPVSKVLDNLLVHKGEPFNEDKKKGWHYYYCIHAQYIIKVYDKSLQFDLPNNVLRFEVKVLTMQFLRKKGVEVRYFADLLNLNIYEPLSKILIETFEGILFRDNSIDENLIEKKDEKTYLRGINKEEWKPKNGNSAEWKRLARMEIAFRSIIEKYRTGLDFQRVVAQLITAKCAELCNPPPQDERFLSMENVHYLATSKDNSDSEIDSEKMENVHYLDLNYTLNTGQPENSINEQPKIKKCSGCRKVLKDNQKTYCSEKCKIGKNRRNDKSNPRHGFIRKYGNLLNACSLF
jgi:hypothetical protein